MKVTIIHNPTAGAACLDRATLLEAIAGAGLEASYHSTKEGSIKKALQDPGALVIAAGGDGTVIKVARQLRNRVVPTVIVPSGTANNIARVLGLAGDPMDLLEQGLRGRPTAIDLGVVVVGGRERLFLEGVGFGLFPAVIRVIDREEEEAADGKERDAAAICGNGPDLSANSSELDRDLKRWLEVLEELAPRKYEVNVDGRDVGGEYLMVEVMNLPILGPNLTLAPRADPTDGILELLLVREDERERLRRFLEKRLHGEVPDWDGTTLRGEKIEIGWRRGAPRRDDRLWKKGRRGGKGKRRSFEVRVDHGAFILNVPG